MRQEILTVIALLPYTVYAGIFYTCIPYEPLVIVYRLSLKQCAYECSCFDGCSYINYNRLARKCQLYDVWSFPSKGNCSGITADITFLESRYSITAASCSTNGKYCLEMQNKNNSIILGNTYEVGAKRKITCIRPYAINDSATVICLNGGSWSFSGQCIKACPAPIIGDYMICLQINGLGEEGKLITTTGRMNKIPAEDYLEGSAMTIACTNSNLSKVVTCSSGFWTNFPVCGGTGGMREFCLVDDECVDQNSQCRNNRCWCKRRRSYNRTASSCVTSCTDYGDTFQILRRWSLLDYERDKTLVNISRMEDCIPQCLSKTAYVCKAINYDVKSHACFFYDIVPDDIGWDDFEREDGFMYLQRDCL